MELELPNLLSANAVYAPDPARLASRPEPARRLAILTCMDTRLDLCRPLGLEVGDAHFLRNAGGRVTPDAVRSLSVSTHLLGTREIGVVHHTRCGLEGVRDEEIAARTGVDDLSYLAFGDLDQSVRDDVAALCDRSELAEGVVVWGAVYDVDTAAVRVVVEPHPT